MISFLKHHNKKTVLNTRKNEDFVYYKMIVSVFGILFFTSQYLIPSNIYAQIQNTDIKEKLTYTVNNNDNNDNNDDNHDDNNDNNDDDNNDNNDSWILSPHPNNEGTKKQISDDDSWILSPHPNTGGTKKQISDDDSWILSPHPNNEGTPKKKKIQKHIELNSAPSNPKISIDPKSTQTVKQTSLPIEYTTPNGTFLTNISNSYSIPTSVVNSFGLGSLSAIGPLSYNSLTGIFSISQAISTASGYLSATDWNTFNNKENILTFGSGLTRIGNSVSLISGLNGEVLSMSGGMPTWMAPGVISIPVLTVFGRTGSVTSQTGDYTTSQVTEGSNLYYTDARAQNALSGTTNTTNTNTTNLTTLSGNLITTNSTLSTTNSNINTLSGNLNTTNTNLSTTNSNLTSLSGTVNTLSGSLSTLTSTVSTKIGLTALSALGPLSYNNLTGVFSLLTANSTTTGALSATDWNIFNNKIGSINGLTGAIQTFTIGNSGTDFNISSLGGTHTFNVPDASTISRGFMSTGSQTFTGTKSFINAPTFSSITTGSLIFAGISGTVSQDNNNLFWNNSTKRLGIGTNTPMANLHIQTTNTGDILRISSGANNIFRVQTDTDLALDTAKVTIGSGNTAKPEGLARDQLYVYGRMNSSWDSFRCDFLTPQNTLAADTYQICGGLGYDVTVGGSLAIVNLAGVSGTDRLSTTATGGNTSALSSMGQTPTQRSLNPVFESRIIVNTATARAAVGFTDLALGGRILADTNNSNNEIFFRKTALGTTWQTVTRSAAGIETVNATTATTIAMRALRIEVNDLAGKVFFYIDGNLVATHTTGIPLAATRLGYWVGITTSVAAIATMDVDYIKFWSDDPDSIVAPSNSIIETSTVSIDYNTLKGSDIVPDIVWNSRSVLKDINYIYDRSSIGKNISSNTEHDTMTIDEYAAYTTNTMKRSLEKLSGQFIDTDLNVKNLCLSGICVSSGQLNAFLSGANSVQNIYNTTTVVHQSSSEGSVGLSTEQISALEYLNSLLKSPVIRLEARFDELITFMKGVIFQSSVTFQNRVTFEDQDMVGNATIKSGTKSVHINFNTPYTTIPRIIVTPDNFVSYRVTNKKATGFNIEIQHAFGEDISFDWIAILGGGVSSHISTNIIQTIPDTDTSSIPSGKNESSPILPQINTNDSQKNNPETVSGEIISNTVEITINTGSTNTNTGSIENTIDTNNTAIQESTTETEKNIQIDIPVQPISPNEESIPTPVTTESGTQNP